MENCSLNKPCGFVLVKSLQNQMPPLREMVRNFEVQEQRVILLSKCYGAMREMRHSLIKPIHTHKYSSQMRGNTMREVGTWVDRSEWIDAPIEFM